MHHLKNDLLHQDQCPTHQCFTPMRRGGCIEQGHQIEFLNNKQHEFFKRKEKVILQYFFLFCVIIVIVFKQFSVNYKCESFKFL